MFKNIGESYRLNFILIMIQILISEQSIIYAPLGIPLAAFSHIFPSEPGEHVLSYGSPIL